MRNKLLAATALAALAAPAAAQELRIGYLNTTTGGGAVLGNHFAAGWKLGMKHQGWEKDGDKLGGVPARMFYADDQAKPDTGRSEVDKLLKQHRVQIVAGHIWTNVTLAVAPLVLDAKAIFLTNNSGPSNFAGESCTPLFVATSWQNDDNHEAGGAMVQAEGLKTVVAMAPNYQAGKDSYNAFARHYKGKVLETIYFKFGETDYQAELAKVRALKPEGVFVFAPGAMGIAFMKQWTASGLGRDIKLYTVFMVDNATLPGIGDAAIGSFHPSMWNPDSPDPRNQRFVKDYLAANGHMPSHFAVQAYDGLGLIAAGVKATGGKVDDLTALARAMRKAGMSSPRGDLKFNVNGFPIQDFYKREVVKGPDGKPVIKGGAVVFKDKKDIYWEKCPAANRT